MLCGALLVPAVAYLAAGSRPAAAVRLQASTNAAYVTRATSTTVPWNMALLAAAERARAAIPGTTAAPTTTVKKPAAPPTTGAAPATTAVAPTPVPPVAPPADSQATTSTAVKPPATTTTTVPLAPVTTILQQVTGAVVATTHSDSGVASWFGAPSGTCAHRTLPMGTVLKVTRLSTGSSVECRVNDRGPSDTSRLIDLSRDTFEKLASTQAGLIEVKVEW